jgi:hypothetical protein
MPRHITTAIAFVLFGAACAILPGGRKGQTAGTQSIMVDVLNENYYDARIHAVYDGGHRRSLGTIAGNGGRARIALPWEPRALVFEVFLVTAGATYVSHPVDVVADESVELRVPLKIAASGFFRRVSRN